MTIPFESMNPLQRRLHNAACVLQAEGDEHGFAQLQIDAIDEVERLRADAERYRWLRDRMLVREIHEAALYTNLEQQESIDAAIDEAMKVKP